MGGRYMLTTSCSNELFLPNQHFNFYFFNSPKVERHRHLDFYEIFIVTEGTFTHDFNGEQSTLKRRDFCIVRPGDTHALFAIDPKSPAQHMNIRITPEYFEKECSEIGYTFASAVKGATQTFKHMSKEEFSHFSYWLNRLLAETNKEKSEFMLKTIIRFLLSLFYADLSTVNSDFPMWLNSLLVKIHTTNFIDKSAKDIYEMAHYSSNYTIKTFKKYLGVTPSEYLNKLKLNYVCNLLENTDYTILYISNEIGFTSLSYFISFFKNGTGKTPAEFRNDIKKRS